MGEKFEGEVPPQERKENEPLSYEVKFYDRGQGEGNNQGKIEKENFVKSKKMTTTDLKDLLSEYKDPNKRHHDDWVEVWRGGKRIAKIGAEFPAGESMDYGALLDPDSLDDFKRWSEWSDSDIQKEADRLRSTLEKDNVDTEHRRELYEAASGGDNLLLEKLEK